MGWSGAASASGARRYSITPCATYRGGRGELYAWTLDYDPDFLGYMDGVLKTKAVAAGEFMNA